MALFGGQRRSFDMSAVGNLLLGSNEVARRRALEDEQRQRALMAQQQQQATALSDRLRAQLSPADGPNGSGTGAAPSVEEQLAVLNEARLVNPAVADKFSSYVQGNRLREMTQGLPLNEQLAIELNPERAGQSFATQFEDMPLAAGTVRSRGSDIVAGAPRVERFDDRFGIYDPISRATEYSQPRGATRGEMLDVSKYQQADRQFYDNLGLEQQKIDAQRGASARDTETNLRKEFDSLPDVKAFNEVAAAYSAVQTAAENPTAAGDLSLIFGYMKMLDPGSVVRETEFANAQNAAGVPDQIRNMYNRALRGERLNPAQRQDFVNQAGNLFGARQERYNQIYQQYQGLAQSYGADASRVTGSADRPAQRPIAVNPQTGQRVQWNGQQWVPIR